MTPIIRRSLATCIRLSLLLFAGGWLITVGCRPAPVPAGGNIVKGGGPDSSNSFWVRHDLKAQKARAIVFIHGVIGEPRESWTNAQTGAFFPDLVAKDPTFADADVFVVAFPSPPFRRSYSIDQLTEKVYRELRENGVLDFQDIVFVTHSMGGIVARALVLKYSEVRPKIRMMQFFSTPFAGADLASFAAALSRNPQFAGMVNIVDNTYLQSQQSTWNAQGLATAIKTFCAYELRPTYGRLVVTLQSATLLCNQRLDPIDGNHIDIVKPPDAKGDAFLAFKIAYSDSYLIADYTPLTQQSLAAHLAALSGSGPLHSFSIAEPIDLGAVVQDAQHWTVLNLRFEGAGALILGAVDLSLTVRGSLSVPFSRPKVFSSGWPAKPSPAAGADGAAGANGAAGSGDGDAGARGGPGANGQSGTGGLRSGDLSLVLSALPTAVFRAALVGQDGGQGGKGGPGGSGGLGHSGRTARSGAFGCMEGGGNGGAGGDGGRGGDGGAGGACGRGGALTVVLPEHLRSAFVERELVGMDPTAAHAGAPGLAGAGGAAGGGGGMGHGNGFCGGGNNGNGGSAGAAGSMPPPGQACPPPTLQVVAALGS